MSSIEDEESRRRKLEEALEVKSLRRIISAYLKYVPLLSSHILPFLLVTLFDFFLFFFFFRDWFVQFSYVSVVAVFNLLPRFNGVVFASCFVTASDK